jgi:uncharacterized protein (TIGR04222 family)
VRKKVRDLNSKKNTNLKPNFGDPYLIAYLRGGSAEAVRLCIFSLIDRGLLKIELDLIKTTSNLEKGFARRDLEAHILLMCNLSCEASKIIDLVKSSAPCEKIKSDLISMGLFYGSVDKVKKRKYQVFGATLLLSTTIYKITLALQRGKSNVQFLIIISAAALFALAHFTSRERNGFGDENLKSLKNLFESLKNRARELLPNQRSNEATLVAAIYGLNILAPEKFSYLKKIFPQSQKNNNSSNSSCGSSCGSSSGSSCGSSCGGGCGGCGGD